MGKPFYQPTKLFLSARGSEGSAFITPNNYQDLPPLNQNIYSDESEFAVLNLFDSLDAVRAFAGPDYTTPVFEPEARQLLSKVEPRAFHYEVKMAPE